MTEGDDARLGRPVPDWTPPPRPNRTPMDGRFTRLEPLTPDHAADLFRANTASDSIWDYLPYCPFADLADLAAYRGWVAGMARQDDPLLFAIREVETGHWAGAASYLRITPEVGTIELGHINLAPELQRTLAATEAMVLMGPCLRAGLPAL